MELERNHSNFVRDLLVKVVLIVLFIFLLTKLFPMPNLTTFYDAVFNNNVQTMKEAAEDWFTTERMPKEVGDEETLSLQDMLDKKLILPFVDKDGNTCDTKKSYVTVKKEEKEYILKVYLSCNGKSDYIIEPIGCYNFCPDGKCETPLVETNEKGEIKVNIPTGTNKKPVVTVTDTGDKYKLQYLYKRTLETGKWVTGDWQETTEKEDKNTKLVDTRTLYTGQKKVEKGKTLYKHVKYAYKDNWSYDTDWLDEVKTPTDNVRLYAKRTLYHGQKRIEEKVTKYKHKKITYTDNWTTTDWSTTKRETSKNVVLSDTRYTVRKTITKKEGSWSAWQNDTTWRSSKPADTATKQWKGPYDTKSDTSWTLLYSSYPSRTQLTQYQGDRKYDEISRGWEDCTTACNGQAKVMVYYYKVYQKKTTNQYRYQYRTYSEKETSSVDEKVVKDPTSYVNNGYKIVKTEYKYKINNPVEHVDAVWTDSIVPPAGYTYVNASSTSITIRYENLGKWVANKNRLGEYTYNVITKDQYKYRYNNPEKYISDTIWTESKTSPSGYTYTGEYKTSSSTSYVDLGKWVYSKTELGEYTQNIKTKKQYKYKHYSSSSTTETKWFDSNPGGDWVYANQTRKIKIN